MPKPFPILCSKLLRRTVRVWAFPMSYNQAFVAYSKTIIELILLYQAGTVSSCFSSVFSVYRAEPGIKAWKSGTSSGCSNRPSPTALIGLSVVPVLIASVFVWLPSFRLSLTVPVFYPHRAAGCEDSILLSSSEFWLCSKPSLYLL